MRKANAFFCAIVLVLLCDQLNSNEPHTDNVLESSSSMHEIRHTFSDSELTERLGIYSAPSLLTEVLDYDFTGLTLYEHIVDLLLIENADSPQKLIEVISDSEQWDLEKRFVIEPDTALYRSAELLGALRLNVREVTDVLIGRLGSLTRLSGGLYRGLSEDFVATSLARAGNIEPVLDRILNFGGGENTFTLFYSILPFESIEALIQEQIDTCKDVKKKENAENFKQRISNWRNTKPESFPSLGTFVLTHPLYLARQSTITENLAALRENKEVLSAVQKLGELRAVEAVEPLVPMLLLKPESRLNELEIGEQLDSIKDYPVAVALAQIGIPSIWGLLNEIAANDHDDQYLEVAYKTMTVILPAVAIPGFVNETIKKQMDELAHLRLSKMYPLMGLEPPVPQPRPSQSSAVSVVPPVELGPFLPRPGESLDDFRKRYVATWGPLPEGHVLNLDGSISNTTVTTIVIPKSGLYVQCEVHPLPEPSNRWKIVVAVNTVLIAIIAALWFFLKRRNTAL